MVRKRGIVFIDGQNLFHRAKREFGHQWPNYDHAQHLGRRN